MSKRLVTYFSVFSNGVHDVRLINCYSWRAYFTAVPASLFSGVALFEGVYFQPSLSFFQVPFVEAFPIDVSGVPGYFINDEFRLTVSGLSPGESFVLQQQVLIE